MAALGVVNCPENAILVKFKVKEGSVVSNGTLLCEYRLRDTNKRCRLKSNLNGTVKELLAKEGDELQLGYHIKTCCVIYLGRLIVQYLHSAEYLASFYFTGPILIRRNIYMLLFLYTIFSSFLTR